MSCLPSIKLWFPHLLGIMWSILSQSLQNFFFTFFSPQSRNTICSPLSLRLFILSSASAPFSNVSLILAGDCSLLQAVSVLFHFAWLHIWLGTTSFGNITVFGSTGAKNYEWIMRQWAPGHSLLSVIILLDLFLIPSVTALSLLFQIQTFI